MSLGRPIDVHQCFYCTPQVMFDTRRAHCPAYFDINVQMGDTQGSQAENIPIPRGEFHARDGHIKEDVTQSVVRKTGGPATPRLPSVKSALSALGPHFASSGRYRPLINPEHGQRVTTPNPPSVRGAGELNRCGSAGPCAARALQHQGRTPVPERPVPYICNDVPVDVRHAEFIRINRLTIGYISLAGIRYEYLNVLVEQGDARQSLPIEGEINRRD
jgi:hypothetical protein